MAKYETMLITSAALDEEATARSEERRVGKECFSLV